MSIYGALFSGVSALSSNSQALGIIADNITNVNTVGYKATTAEFSTLVTSTRTGSTYSPGGVQTRPQALIDQQGLLQTSASPTDISISGDGFFVVNSESQPTANSGTFMFTRAGAFKADEDGFLRNAAGLYLQAWPIDAQGNIPSNRSLTSIQTVNVNNLTGTAQPTTMVSLQANLQSSQTPGAYAAGDMAAGNVTPHFERTIQIIDSKGGARNFKFGFFRDAALPANQWRSEIYAVPATDVTNANGLVSSGIVAFNTDGSFNATATTLPLNLNITTYAAALGIANSSIALDIGTNAGTDGLTQFDSASVLISSEANGAVFGSLTGVAIGEDGVITALFDNGTRNETYKIPIATFPNPNGVGNKSGNAYIATDDSGEQNLQEAGFGGSGKVAPSSLESSTVDLAEEFTNMITTQRAYSAGSRVITTADEMLDELIRIIR